MNLSSIFSRVAHKQLVTVDLPDRGSNQHELNGDNDLREFFGIRESTRGTLTWHYFSDDEAPVSESGNFTFYDAREKSASRTGRSEWRFYYEGKFLERANVGDWFLLVRASSGDLFGLVFQKNSGWLRAARVLFGIERASLSFDAVPEEQLHQQTVALLQRQIIDELGLEVSVPAEPNDQQLMLDRYGRIFPITKEMSTFARTQVEVDPFSPDEALIRWLDREEQLFRALENVIVGERLEKGFDSVDEFVAYSLSVQNRRKSRMGFALQNHLEELFTRHRLRFKAQSRTEGKTKADFIFPGEREYHNTAFEAGLLIMLGVKSTSKDRWRQVLDEADRIPDKHLCTLEPAISTNQTDAMRRRCLTLVIPDRLLLTYTRAQRREIMNVQTFIDLVLAKQRRNSQK
ncbi:MAG TPA: type II restriction endonuclease [Pyrinomonadaceae bacterium]|nr:type II restriction endonuclease [Pyrinomonadaceae bacterium]